MWGLVPAQPKTMHKGKNEKTGKMERMSEHGVGDPCKRALPPKQGPSVQRRNTTKRAKMTMKTDKQTRTTMVRKLQNFQTAFGRINPHNKSMTKIKQYQKAARWGDLPGGLSFVLCYVSVDALLAFELYVSSSHTSRSLALKLTGLNCILPIIW